jgi:hypothetical protein
MALLFAPYFRAADQSNTPIAGAFLSFYQTQTTTPQPVYADVILTIPLTNAVQADGNGVFPQIWLDDSLPPYKIVLQYPDENNPSIPGDIVAGPNGTIDPYNPITHLIKQTSAEIAASIIPTDFTQTEGWITRYGALTTATDNSAALNAAAKVSDQGGAAVFIPPGTWAHTSPFLLVGKASVSGAGASSILAPTSCDGIQLGSSGGVGVARYMRNFQIVGVNTSANNGISCNFTHASGNRVSGMQFSNVTIQNFGQGVFSRGLWQSTFQDCFLYNNYQGYLFHGENIVIHIIGGFIQRGTITGTGTTYGVRADVVSGETTQSLHLLNAACYGYNTNAYINNTLYVEISGCDMSISDQVGIEVNACRGGVFIRNNWIQTNNAAFATVGIAIDTVGTAIEDKVVIDGNTIMCTLANAGSTGVSVGAGNTGVEVINNTIGTAFSGWQFAIGISNASGAHNMLIANNGITASGNCIILGSLSTNVCVHDNAINAGNPIIWDAGTPAGLSYRARGTFTGTITGVTAIVTGTVSWVADGKHVELSIPTAGITGTSNATTMTLTGIPVALWPVTDQNTMANLVDNGTGSYGTALVSAGTGVITFRKDATGAVFTGSGTKGVNGTVIRWPYL